MGGTLITGNLLRADEWFEGLAATLDALDDGSPIPEGMSRTGDTIRFLAGMTPPDDAEDLELMTESAPYLKSPDFIHVAQAQVVGPNGRTPRAPSGVGASARSRVGPSAGSNRARAHPR